MKKIQFNLVILSAFIFVISSCNPVENQVECTNCKCFKSNWKTVLEGGSIVGHLDEVYTTSVFYDFCENNGLHQTTSNGHWTVQHCDCENIEKNRVYIYSVVASPTVNESVTLKNNSDSTVNISGWKIGKKQLGYVFTIPNGTVLNNQQTITFSAITLGFISGREIKDGFEAIYLNNNQKVLDIWTN
jgi:hypothetical protein